MVGKKTENSYWAYEISPETKGDIILSTPTELDIQDMNMLLTECGADTRMKSQSLVENQLGAKDIAWRNKWLNTVNSLIEDEKKIKSLEKELAEKKRQLDGYIKY